MRRLSLTMVAVCAVVMFGNTVHAQQPASPPPAPPAYGPSVTTEQAKKAVAAAIAEAKKTPYQYTFAVVDPTGHLVYFEKMDDAISAATNIAIGKARTAATFKRPSKALFDAMESGHPYVATLDPSVVAAAGGLPLIVNGKIIGAIGVSGGPSGLIDLAAAEAGANALK